MGKKLVDALLIVSKPGVPLFIKNFIKIDQDDTILFAGALTAIQSLMREATEEQVRSVELQSSEYIIEQGKHIYIAIKSRAPMFFPILRIMAKEIGKKFEEKYETELSKEVVETNIYDSFDKELTKIFENYGYHILERLFTSPYTAGLTIFDRSYNIILSETLDSVALSTHEKENVSALLGQLMVETAKAIWAPVSRQIDMVEKLFIGTTIGFLIIFEWTRKIIISSIIKPKIKIPYQAWKMIDENQGEDLEKVLMVLRPIVNVFEKAVSVVQWGGIDFTLLTFKKKKPIVFYPRKGKIFWSQGLSILDFHF